MTNFFIGAGREPKELSEAKKPPYVVLLEEKLPVVLREKVDEGLGIFFKDLASKFSNEDSQTSSEYSEASNNGQAPPPASGTDEAQSQAPTNRAISVLGLLQRIRQEMASELVKKIIPVTERMDAVISGLSHESEYTARHLIGLVPLAENQIWTYKELMRKLAQNTDDVSLFNARLEHRTYYAHQCQSIRSFSLLREGGYNPLTQLYAICQALFPKGFTKNPVKVKKINYLPYPPGEYIFPKLTSGGSSSQSPPSDDANGLQDGEDSLTNRFEGRLQVFALDMSNFFLANDIFQIDASKKAKASASASDSATFRSSESLNKGENISKTTDEDSRTLVDDKSNSSLSDYNFESLTTDGPAYKSDGPPQLSKRDLAKHDKKQKRKEGAVENRNAAMAEDETSKARVDLSFGLDQGKDCAVWNEDEATLNREILWLNHVKDGQWLINLVYFRD